MRIFPAETSDDWADVERLIRAYVEELPFELDFQDLARELAELPKEYGPPSGTALLMQAESGARIGIVGVRRFAEGEAELKRMYLAPTARGGGAGRALGAAAVDAARTLGYRRLLLDTVAWMTAAIAAYEDLGFVEIAAYRHNPLEGARYFSLVL